MQKRLHFAVLVKGLFPPAKNSFSSAPLTELKLRAFRPHRSNRGAGLTFYLPAGLIGQFWGLSQREPASHRTLKIE